MPDERAVMTYVSSYYHCFSGAQKVCVFCNSNLTYNKRIDVFANALLKYVVNSRSEKNPSI